MNNLQLQIQYGTLRSIRLAAPVLLLIFFYFLFIVLRVSVFICLRYIFQSFNNMHLHHTQMHTIGETDKQREGSSPLIRIHFT